MRSTQLFEDMERIPRTQEIAQPSPKADKSLEQGSEVKMVRMMLGGGVHLDCTPEGVFYSEHHM